ncbi:Peptidase M15A, C-terminal [uncultured Caudovirales phage]|uniref:Peptidase M15A, C-terminal n=1 Tax=uncultured Caudovirales phage TaxID=2100421 RepID=A0A6J5S1B9_9CAUD|nr:Peptidase M15A, C-terminal [uncultured Caudovirales phage]
MITLKELNPRNRPLTHDQEANLELLHKAINKVRTAYGKPMVVTSGFRSVEDQQRINPKASASKHLLGLAVDIADADGKLWAWCVANLSVIEEAGLYLEDGASTKGWVHFQASPPKSGRRIFKP